MKKFTLLLILVLATVLRWYNNTAVSLWHDEAFSALYIKYGWGEMVNRIILDVHPPLYYFVLRLWSYIFGDSLLSLRGLSIIFGVLTVWMGYIFVKKAFQNQNLALMAALFLAINPFQIQYALEARMYTLGTFLVLLSSYYVVRALESGRKKDWVYYGIAAAAAFYTHYYLLFSIVAQGLYALWVIFRRGEWRNNWDSNQLINLAMAGGIAAVLYLPWLKPLMEQLTRVQGGYWIPPMDRWSVPGTIWKITLGGQGMNHTALVVGVLIALTALIFFIKKFNHPEKWLVIFSLVIPFLAAVLLSLRSDIYLDRYFVFASLYMSLLLAGAVYGFHNINTKRVMLTAFTVISLAFFSHNWKVLDVREFGSSTIKKPGMSAASQYLTERVSPSDKVYVGSSLIFFTFKYYNETNVTPLLISDRPLKDIPHYSGTAIMTDQDLILTDQMFRPENYRKNDIIWLLWTTGWGGNKPNVPGKWVPISQTSWKETPDFKGEIYATQYRVE
jgi:mannosyltransferase